MLEGDINASATVSISHLCLLPQDRVQILPSAAQGRPTQKDLNTSSHLASSHPHRQHCGSTERRPPRHWQLRWEEEEGGGVRGTGPRERQCGQCMEVARARRPGEQQAETWTGARLRGPGRSGQAALGAQPHELLCNHVHILVALTCHLCHLPRFPGGLHPLAASPDFQVARDRAGEGWPGEHGEGKGRNLWRERERLREMKALRAEPGLEIEATGCGVKITKPPRDRRPWTERGGRGSSAQREGNQAASRTRGRARRGQED